ncbi:MAG TPA: nitrilase-related carbon-nitrogen hydrolase, partial [Candidatus Berkiella sp.]|nr:nitrilase-related carbon-nitrogen hydrolase [Candidatus Berkiella sp.]
PSNVGKQQQRLTQFSSIAKRCQAPLVFTNQVGGNDDIVFDGASFILDKTGKVLGTLPSFSESVGTFTFDEGNIHSLNHFQHTALLPEMALCYQQIILGLQDYIQKCGFQQVALGVSGGLDSA